MSAASKPVAGMPAAGMPVAGKPVAPIRVYSFPLSGHAHRVRLFLSLLGLPFETVDIDLAAGAQREPAFLALNPLGQVPVIDDDGTVLADSNAILVYLAKRYGDAHWLPDDAAGAATVQRWLSFAAGPIASGPAAARLVTVFGASLDHDAAKRTAAKLLDVIDRELAGKPFAAGARPTIADIAAYTYIAHAPEGGVSLDAYPHLRAWLARIEALPGFIGMQPTRAGLLAA
ncbi:Disulfide-bond oxidoreductase YfcG [Burkholderia pseudomultivorans]|uniref:Disulfide-bond oxidoreductase YfcG n=2 Tax=Burkholderia pseudomultivorans TaxID=1207504 RepID=A0ABU2E1B6_9BURK|nr:Disulfide-bond oxidoreductase YfcG [Burkholderia pseudomultivorans]MDR8734316.1 Disulfide-bond oxidoreductase YfcG [Burkholderia pseudomultivorans]MDR8742286.1 Disulfide-bond oxidoreductase YfcG [Burkholderia pseudomultivorans]MDR8753615.1 Disulfide-bond oxidoreductase YfcG [Burkholderia pseudomultivorans]MDR8775716.1 Disulfide-bond oxidoreductase YfcG [Burkholderia pseudomultivorans]